MVRGFYRDIVEVLRAHGCTFRRQGMGDHEIWFSPISGRTFTVDRASLSRHTVNAVIKQAGIDRRF